MTASARFGVVLLMLLPSLGCEVPELPPGEPSAPPTTADVKPAPADKPFEPVTDLPEIATPVTNDPRPVLPDDPIQGRRSQKAGGHLGAVGHANFYARHKIIYDQVKMNLGLYMATSADGNFPKSHEEFMEGVIKAYNMELPELEPQHEYIYVPEEAELGLQIRLKPPSKEGAAAQADATASPQPTPAADSATSESRPVEATDPAQGRKSREAGGYLGAVGSARFTSENQLTFNMVKKNLDLFEATNSRYPESQKEFMQAVVVEGGVSLPELPEEMEYFYDPEEPTAGLQVRDKQSE